MPLQDEPILEIDDIQGHILIGFRGLHQQIVGFKFVPDGIGAARAVLLGWMDKVTSTRAALENRTQALQAAAAGLVPPVPERVLMALAVTSAGMEALGAETVPEDPDFRSGAGRSAAALSDPVDPENGVPIGWRYGDTSERTPDLLAIFGGGDPVAVLAEAEALIEGLRGLATVVARDAGARLPQDIEHFGFADGISQPAPRGRIDDDVPLVHRTLPPGAAAANLFARPGRPLVWPGQYVFGYQTQRADSSAAGPVAGGPVSGLRNGSLLVLRRLRQDVAAFQDGMQRLAEAFGAQGLDVTPATAAAWCVGRWPDGSPLVLAPDAPDVGIGADEFRRNGFLFNQPTPATELTLPDGTTVAHPGAPADRFGLACPLFAHIRQVNPRDDPVDFGGNGMTLRSQMLRRGIPYGPAWTGTEDGIDRGLIFMSYQTSISNQFHRLIKRWVNDGTAPLSRSGIDPLIGADKFPGRALERRKPDNSFARTLLQGNWVSATGAIYAFTPGISALRGMLAGQGV